MLFFPFLWEAPHRALHRDASQGLQLHFPVLSLYFSERLQALMKENRGLGHETINMADFCFFAIENNRLEKSFKKECVLGINGKNATSTLDQLHT